MNEELEEMKLSSKIKCPKCKSRKLEIGQVCIFSIPFYTDENGVFEGTGDCNDSGPTGKLEIRCEKCGHSWNKNLSMNAIFEEKMRPTNEQV